MSNYHKYPEVPDWFRPHLERLREAWGTHLLKVTAKVTVENVDGEEEESTETIFVRYVPWDSEDFLEYIREGRPYWWRENLFKLMGKESPVELIKGKHDRIKEEWGEEFIVKLRGKPSLTP